MLRYFWEKCSRVIYSTQGFFWINFLFFQALFCWQLKPKSTVCLTPPLTVSHLFCLPQLIHIVTPFNRGQAVKDPITEVKHTFHISSVDLKVWTTNFMWKCIEIGGGFMRGAVWSGGEEGKVERLGREGSVRMEGPESGASERFKR